MRSVLTKRSVHVYVCDCVRVCVCVCLHVCVYFQKAIHLVIDEHYKRETYIFSNFNHVTPHHASGNRCAISRFPRELKHSRGNIK